MIYKRGCSRTQCRIRETMICSTSARLKNIAKRMSISPLRKTKIYSGMDAKLDTEREFWIAIRAALLQIVAAISKRFMIGC